MSDKETPLHQEPLPSIFGTFALGPTSPPIVIRSIAFPIWFLILLHTLFFTLLYLLAHRHFQKKALWSAPAK